jgi:hypothetical protein
MLVKREAKLLQIEEQLAASTKGGKIATAGEATFTETKLNPLGRAGEKIAPLEGATYAERQALYKSAEGVRGEIKNIGRVSTAIDLAIALPFAAPLVGDIASTSSDPVATGQKLSNLVVMGAGASGVLGKTFTTEATLGKGIGGSEYTVSSLGIKTRMPFSTVENFYPALSIVKSPTEGFRIPGTSKEFGYSLKTGTPSVFSEARDIQPARIALSPEQEFLYAELVKQFKSDARSASELPGLQPIGKIKRTDAMIQKALKELEKVDKKAYERLPAGELEKVIELSVKYKELPFDKVSPSGKILPAEGVDTGLLQAELIRGGAYKDVNSLSPISRQLVYETVRTMNEGKEATPLARVLRNADDAISGKKPTYAQSEINKLPTQSERLFGEARLENISPMETRLVQKYLTEAEQQTIATAELKLITLEKRIGERKATINKLERDIMRDGKVQITKSDVNSLGGDV